MKKLETSFFLNRIYFSTRKCMFPTFSKNLPLDYAAALTKDTCMPFNSLIEYLKMNLINISTAFV